MKKDNIKKVLLLGSGALKIGEAGELVLKRYSSILISQQYKRQRVLPIRFTICLYSRIS